jgi:hypothetical protein
VASIIIGSAMAAVASLIKIPISVAGLSLGKPPTKKELFVEYCQVIGAVALLFVFIDLILLSTPYGVVFIEYLMRKLGVRAAQLFVSVVVLILGSLAYWFKLKKQVWYGVVEIAFAASAAVIAARQLKPGTEWAGPIATLGGAVYIVNRGLENVAKGRAPRTRTTT